MTKHVKAKVCISIDTINFKDFSLLLLYVASKMC